MREIYESILNSAAAEVRLADELYSAGDRVGSAAARNRAQRLVGAVDARACTSPAARELIVAHYESGGAK